MKFKMIILIVIILGILLLSLFSFGLKEKAIKGIVSDTPGYNCDNDNICTSCIINEHLCNCGEHKCDCGNETVDRIECDMLS